MASRLTYSRIYEALWRTALKAIGGGARARQVRGEFDFERRVLLDPVAAVRKLKIRFTESELTAAGVARRGQDGKLFPEPALGGEEVELVAMRRRREEPPRELLTRTGCLRITSLHAMLDDYRLRARLSCAHGYVDLAVAWDDWLWFDALGLPVIYCADLVELDASRLLRIQACLKTYAGWRRPRFVAPALGSDGEIGADCLPAYGAAAAETAPADDDPVRTSPGDSAATPASPSLSPDDQRAQPGLLPSAPRQSKADAERSPPSVSETEPLAAAEGHRRRSPLHPAVVIVAWSPSAGSHDRPAGLQTQLETLAEAQKLLAHRLPELIVWTPDGLGQRALSLYARGREMRWREDAIVDSVETSGRTLASACAASRPSTYVSARADYHEALKRYHRREIRQHELAACQEVFERSLERDVVERLLECKPTLSDPRQWANRAVTAELVRQYLCVAPLHFEQLSRMLAQADAAVAANQSAGVVRDGLALVKALAALAKTER